jgi:ATP synthase delta (OSCP) subunit
MDQIDLSDLFTTKAEANDFLARLTSISEMFFQTGFNFESALTVHFGINKRDRIISILHANNINTESLPSVKEFIFVLMSKISSLPVLALTIAFEPQEQTLKTLAEWFFINMHKQMLFDISVDKNVIAGARITYNGKFYDFSVRPTFEKILQTYLARLSTQTVSQIEQPAKQPTQQPTATPPQTVAQQLKT